MSGAVRAPRARRAAADSPPNDRPCHDLPCHDRAHVESGEAAAQLRESRRLLAQLERIGGFGSFVFDLVARTLSWSDELYRLHGTDRDDFTDPGAEPLRYVHPDDHERTMAFLATVAATVAADVETPELEYRIIRPDGETRWLVARAQRDCDDPRRVVGTVHDVTDRRRAEQALRASEERYQSIAENLPGMVYQFVREADGSMRFPFVSEGSAEIYGLEPAQLRAEASLIGDLIHPDDREEFRATVLESARTLAPWRWEGRVVPPTGGVRWLQGASRPRPLADGGVHWDGVLLDRTAARQTEQHLAQQSRVMERERTFLHTVLENLSDAVIACGPDGVLTVFNPAAQQLHGLPAGPVPADRWAEHYALLNADGSPMPSEQVPLFRALRGETLRDLEMAVAHPDGTRRLLSVNAQPLRDASGENLGAVAAMRDVTAERQARAQRDREATRLEAAIAVQRDVTAAVTDRDATLRMVAERADALFPTADGAVVELLDGDRLLYTTATGTMTPYVGTRVPTTGSLSGPTTGSLSGPTTGSLSGLATASRTMQRCDEPATDPRADDAACDPLVIGSMLIAPLCDGDRAIGVLKVSSAATGAFDDDDRRQLELLAGAVGSALRHAEDYADNARLLAERTTALTALADSEERFRSAFARAPLGMFITSLREDDRGRLLRVNPAACAMLGYTEDELHERTFAGISHPDDIPRDYDAIPRLISGEWNTYQTQKRYLHRDGHLVWAELHSAAVRDASGDVVSVVTQVRDITDERAAADRLRQQAELLDLTQDAIIVRDLDSRIIFWNGGAETTYGWPSQQACGHVTHRLLRTRRTDGGEMSDVGRTLLTDGRWDGELIHLRADGSSITVASRQVLRRDPDGTPAVILETNTDITARVAAERALADREQRFRTQFELAPIAQAVAGLDGQITEVNDAYCALFGRSRSDLLVTNYRDMIHPDDRPAHLARFANLFAGQYDGYQRHKRMLRADGGIVEVNSYLTLVRDAQGRPEAIISQLQDITDRRQAERDRDAAAAQLAERNAQLERSNVDLQAANQLKLDLMGMLSHEIGTPLTAILGHAEIAEEVTDPTQRAHRSLVVIRRNAERLAAMRTEILTMCALDTAQLTADRERVPLADAIAQTLVAVETDIPVIGAADRTALVSPSHLQHILINFLTNAAKYAGGATEVHVSGDDVSVEIRVHDKGPGVPEELRDHLFERFTRGTDSPSRAHGTGLGLYIVRGLAEANSGQVWHEPRHPQGSAFALRLARAGR